MNPTKNRILKINKEIQSLQHEKKIIQIKCPHKSSSHIKYSYRIGVVEDVLMCNDCEYIKYEQHSFCKGCLLPFKLSELNNGVCNQCIK